MTIDLLLRALVLRVERYQEANCRIRHMWSTGSTCSLKEQNTMLRNYAGAEKILNRLRKVCGGKSHHSLRVIGGRRLWELRDLVGGRNA